MREISGIIVLIIFTATGICLFAGVLINHILLLKFKTKYPEIAIKEIPFIDELKRDPEKFLYFFRKRSKDFLKEDNELWKLRQSMFFLLISALLLPVALVVSGLCLMIIGKG